MFFHNHKLIYRHFHTTFLRKGLSKDDIQKLADLGNRIRIHSVKATHASRSGHPTTCSSCADILSVLFFHVMNYKVCEPKHPSSDRFILSKGHAAPALYAAWVEAGLFPETDLLKLRKLESNLEGHPTPRLNFIDVATGSLGQGLSVANGMAYCGKYIDKSCYRVYCLLGDGETAEGAVWEAVQFASYYQLDNLCAVIDINRLGQSQETMLGHDLQVYKNRLEAFGFATFTVNGHCIEELIDAFDKAKVATGQPSAILAMTLKGKNFPEIEDQENWHGKPIPGDKFEKVLSHLQGLLVDDEVEMNPKPFNEDDPYVKKNNLVPSCLPDYKTGDSVATRKAYGNALLKLARKNERVIVLDGDMSNSTFSETVKFNLPNQFVECFICEQNMIGTAVGLQCRDRCIVFASTFGAFLTRAFDQIRMAAISYANLNICGSHCGVTIGEDGTSQMALEDIAMFRTIPGSTIFYPSDAVAAERAVQLAAVTPGISFIRANRPATKVFYKNDQRFYVGKANILKSSPEDKVLVIAAGVTIIEALEAHAILAKAGTSIRIMDPFTVKPIDKSGIIKHAGECCNKIIVVEDHYYEGGIGSAVLEAIAMETEIQVKHLAVGEVPRSGPPNVLLKKYGIDSTSIVKIVNELTFVPEPVVTCDD